MSVALRQQSLNLPPDKRKRYDTIKAEIRQWSPRAEMTKGTEAMQVLERLTALRSELAKLIEVEVPGKKGTAMAAAGELVTKGDAVVAPIVTNFGGKMLIVAAADDVPSVVAIDLPALDTQHLNELMFGNFTLGKDGGWVGAYGIQSERHGDWLDAIDHVGKDLWGLFGQAMYLALQKRGVKQGARIVWLPTSFLGLLPVGLAQDPASGVRLDDIYELVYAPNLEALTAASRQLAVPPTRSLAAAINPTGEIPGLALPFTEIEGALVARHFAGKQTIILDKSTASPELVLEALKGKSYWHFSSHGKFDLSDARNSGLIMRGEQNLTVGRLIETEGNLGHPRLVVLSACETGLYEFWNNPEEFFGLPATLMQIGAAGVLASLWQVDDLATALLMAKFYDLHLRDGITPPAALKRAQAWLRNATKAELIDYAKAAAEKSKLDPAKVVELEASLMSLRRADSRFGSVWRILQGKRATEVASVQGAPAEDKSLQSRPFAHPYYWGGFVYTGL
jgi:CHAT domain-containing protein